jgi:hypothetical protein
MRRWSLVVAAVTVACAAVAIIANRDRTEPSAALPNEVTRRVGPRLELDLYRPRPASSAVVHLQALEGLPNLIRAEVEAACPAWTFAGLSSPGAVDGKLPRTLEWETPAPLRLHLTLCRSDRIAEKSYRMNLLRPVGPTRVEEDLGNSAAVFGRKSHCQIVGRVGPVVWMVSGREEAALRVSRCVVDVVERTIPRRFEVLYTPHAALTDPAVFDAVVRLFEETIAPLDVPVVRESDRIDYFAAYSRRLLGYQGLMRHAKRDESPDVLAEAYRQVDREIALRWMYEQIAGSARESGSLRAVFDRMRAGEGGLDLCTSTPGQGVFVHLRLDDETPTPADDRGFNLRRTSGLWTSVPRGEMITRGGEGRVLCRVE